MTELETLLDGSPCWICRSNWHNAEWCGDRNDTDHRCGVCDEYEAWLQWAATEPSALTVFLRKRYHDHIFDELGEALSK